MVSVIFYVYISIGLIMFALMRNNIATHINDLMKKYGDVLPNWVTILIGITLYFTISIFFWLPLIILSIIRVDPDKSEN